MLISAHTTSEIVRSFFGTTGLVAALSLFLSLLGGCGQVHILDDPLHRSEMEALGPEDPAVAVGPLHRAGQPCGACHRPDGAAGSFLAAGTIYRDPVSEVGVGDAEVLLTDSEGHQFSTKTNCVGNFYVRNAEFQPVLPFWTSVQLGEFPYKMASPIHREISCAKCHFDPVGPASAGHIFVADDETTFASIPVRSCNASDQVAR